MGLDMYLTAERYVSGWEHGSEEERRAYHAIAHLAGMHDALTDRSPSLDVRATVGYWRKANHIHAWFVNEVQGGQDDCRDYDVSREQLQELRDLCADVLSHCVMIDGKVYAGTVYSGGTHEHKFNDGQIVADPSYAQEHLPTQEGFFFGGTNYDEWYVQDLETTIAQIDRALALDGVTFSYRASW